MILVGIFVTSDDGGAELAFFMNAYCGHDLIIQNQNSYWSRKRHSRQIAITRPFEMILAAGPFRQYNGKKRNIKKIYLKPEEG